MNNFMLIFLMPSAPDQSPVPSFVFLLLIIVVFYFFMIRPQMKKQKDLKSYRAGLNKGDKVVTTGGIYGKITDIKDQTITVEIADNVRIRIDKNAILKDNADLAKQK
ncbi:MAG TPA: preprotein translocase subunit YajC [Bacteroides sp.]|nr:preprotein translocase subunit YajC [Bacteroides sp.]